MKDEINSLAKNRTRELVFLKKRVQKLWVMDGFSSYNLKSKVWSNIDIK